MVSIREKIAARIRDKGRGWVFTAADFLDTESRPAIHRALSQLAREGMIRHLERGMYDYPKLLKGVGMLDPHPYYIACALAPGDRVFPTGLAAANILGLSTQMVVNPIYQTNATTLTRRVGNYTIRLERAKIAWLDTVSEQVNMVIQALCSFGERGIEPYVIPRCAAFLTDRDLAELHDVEEKLPGWMVEVIRRIEQRKLQPRK